MFYFPPLADHLSFNRNSFPFLLIMGFTYMSLAQIALMRLHRHDKYFQVLAKTGILFDYIAYFWLLLLSGGISSRLFPISFLITMHATIYWRTRGAIISSLGVSAGYSMVLMTEGGLILIFCSFFQLILVLFGSSDYWDPCSSLGRESI